MGLKGRNVETEYERRRKMYNGENDQSFERTRKRLPRGLQITSRVRVCARVCRSKASAGRIAELLFSAASAEPEASCSFFFPLVVRDGEHSRVYLFFFFFFPSSLVLNFLITHTHTHSALRASVSIPLQLFLNEALLFLYTRAKVCYERDNGLLARGTLHENATNIVVAR